ncbi:MAG: DUF2202 domain-containing protein, partial [Chloroflexi bacterium]|nr:DUF2202 domain-containing protein [Chloroflexota bacterium]
MYKNIFIGFITAILVVVIGSAAFNLINAQAAGASNPNIAGPGYGGQGRGASAGFGTSGSNNVSNTNLLAIPASDLNTEEEAGLLFMREEEKLARDVYTALYASWNLPAFQNISASEQKHMDEIGLLLTRYNLTDPAQAPGVFTNVQLQKLYNTLVAQGKLSIGDALKVGGAIEEIDILDLQTRLAQTDNADIQQVYNNLMKGSFNHLKAFTNTLASQSGTVYTPQYMTTQQYQASISTTTGSGSGGGRPSWAGQAGVNR